jgi:hypothetical protein
LKGKVGHKENVAEEPTGITWVMAAAGDFEGGGKFGGKESP